MNSASTENNVENDQNQEDLNNQESNNNSERAQSTSIEVQGTDESAENKLQPENVSTGNETGPADVSMGSTKDAKKKHRRKRGKGKRKYKPYDQLTREEREKLGQEEEERAEKLREDMFRAGRPMAPYNTSQYVMSQRSPYEIDLTSSPRYMLCNSSDSPVYISTKPLDVAYMQKGFDLTYDEAINCRLDSCSKAELSKHHASLQEEQKSLQNELEKLRDQNAAAMVTLEVDSSTIDEKLDLARKENERLLLSIAKLEGSKDPLVS